MTPLLPLVLAAALAPAGAADLTAPRFQRTVGDLHQSFIEAVDDEGRQAALDALMRTRPISTKDTTALFDLFMRFPDTRVREACLSSLAQLDPNSPHLEGLFFGYLDQPETEAVLFGLKGALKIRSAKSLPKIKAIAKRPFPFPSVEDAALVSERNIWWLRYEALAAVAQWEKAASLPLLKQQARKVPAVARIMGMFLWPESLGLFEDWARSRRAPRREMARQGLGAPAPLEAVRATRADLLRILRDAKAPRDLRHPVALKLGLSSREDEVDALIQEYAAVKGKDDESQLMYLAALFATRSPKVVPLLTETARTHANPRTREGARHQLRDMLPAKDYRALLEWTAASDPDPDNRQEAELELRGR